LKVVKSCSWDGNSYSLVQTLLLWDVSFSHNAHVTDRQADDSNMPMADGIK